MSCLNHLQWQEGKAVIPEKCGFCLGHLFCQDSAGKQASGMSSSIPFLRQEQTQAKPRPEKQKANREQNKTSFASF